MIFITFEYNNCDKIDIPVCNNTANVFVYFFFIQSCVCLW